MGKSPLPLKIALAGLSLDDDVWKELRAQGHLVEELRIDEGYDLIVGPQCWRILPHLTRYLPLALKEARAAARKRKPRAKAD